MTPSPKVRHLAVVLDGNRRWAKRRGLPVYRGHEAGVSALERLVRACKKRGINELTVFGFSTENWGRSRSEVNALVKVMEIATKRYIKSLDKEEVRLKLIGRPKDFPKSLASLLDKAVHKLSHHRQAMLNVAVSYGGRDEIVRAATKAKHIPGKLTEKKFAELLDTAGSTDPDLVIRTGGRMRLSGFLPWQSTYSELYFTDTLWPDFGPAHLDRALKSFDKRQCNFGK